jgi:hypothetical protein
MNDVSCKRFGTARPYMFSARQSIPCRKAVGKPLTLALTKSSVAASSHNQRSLLSAVRM